MSWDMCTASSFTSLSPFLSDWCNTWDKCQLARKLTVPSHWHYVSLAIAYDFNYRHTSNKVKCDHVLTLTVCLPLYPSYFTNHLHSLYDFRKSQSAGTTTGYRDYDVFHFRVHNSIVLTMFVFNLSYELSALPVKNIHRIISSIIVLSADEPLYP